MAFNFESMREQERKNERRDEIIEMVEEGSLEPSKADKLAADEGLRPLSFIPDANDFDVMNIASWTLEMTVAWIIWRDGAEIAPYYERFVEKCVDWKRLPVRFVAKAPGQRPQPVSRYELGQREKPGLQAVKEGSGWRYQVKVDKGSAVPRYVEYNDAIRVLRARLEEGSLVAHGVKIENLRPSEIEPFEWRYLRLSEVNIGPSPAVSTVTNEAIYRNITFLRSAVMKWWEVPNQSVVVPSVEPEQNGKPVRKASASQIRNAITEAETFLSRKGYLFWTKDEAEAELREMLGATRKQSKAIFAETGFASKFPGEKGRRGPTNSNRDNELEEFRHFFTTANMRK